MTAKTALLNFLLVTFGVSKRLLGRPKRVRVVAVASILCTEQISYFLAADKTDAHALLLLQQHLKIELLMGKISTEIRFTRVLLLEVCDNGEKAFDLGYSAFVVAIQAIRCNRGLDAKKDSRCTSTLSS